jgi:hypothetical protein
MGWAQGYHAGQQQEEPELGKGENKYARAASSDLWDRYDHGGSDAGDKQKLNKKMNTCPAKEWAKQYHKGNPVNLEKFPRVEFWNDTQMEAYKEGVKIEIRREMHNDGTGLEKRLERKLELDYCKEDWMYTAHFSQEILCPSTSWNPSRRK